MMAANRQDMYDIGSPTFLSQIDSKIQEIVLRLQRSPSVPVSSFLKSGFALDELLQARKLMFESAKKKHRDGIQDGAETTKDST